MTDLATIRQVIKTDSVGIDLWAAIDAVRAREGVSLGELDRRLGFGKSTTATRRKRAKGTERLHEAAEMFAAMGWQLTLIATRKQV